jgi:hypothetical protein
MTILLCAIAALLLAGCPPTLPCDEKIADPDAYKKIIQSNSVIQAIDIELVWRQLTISPCFVNGLASVAIRYQMPASFSEYQVIYADELYITYAKDGTLGLPAGRGGPKDFQKSAILAYFKNRILEIESNSRISEVISRTEPDPFNPVIPIYGQVTIFRSGSNQVEYNYFSGLVRGYLLSNNIEWHEFPEIKQAHRVVEDHLLVGELSGCSIGWGDMHAYTTASFHDSPEGPWNMTVALICEDGWKDASVRINPDGSYENLGIWMEYNSK